MRNAYPKELFWNKKALFNVANNDGRNAGIDFEVSILCHFSFCKGMHDFSTRFHKLRDECFADTPICNMKPIVGSKRLHNLQEYLVDKKPNRSLLRIGS